MDHVKGISHILILNDKEMNMLKECVEFFHECTIKSQEFKNDDEPTVETAIELEKMCKTMGIIL